MEAWFTLAATDGEAFTHSLCNDLLLYTSSPYQTIFIGNTSNADHPYARLSPHQISLSTPTVHLGANVVVTATGLRLRNGATIDMGTFEITPIGIAGSNPAIIQTQHLADGCVTDDKLAPWLTLPASNFAPLSVQSTHLVDAAVTTRCLSNGCVTSDKFDAGRLVLNRLEVSGQDTPGATYLGYSNAALVPGNRYALCQTQAGETAINSAASNLLRFSIAGVDAMRLSPDGNVELSGVITQLSDVNHKTDIRPVTGALEKLCQLNGYTYRLCNRPPAHAVSAGLIAQEVQHVLPEAVRPSAAQDLLTLDYAALSCLYVEAIKELYQLVQRVIVPAPSGAPAAG